MRDSKQRFSTSFAKEDGWKPGLRNFFEYRDLGIDDATGGLFSAHVIRVKKPVEPFPHTGPHTHELDFQMIYILRSFPKFQFWPA